VVGIAELGSRLPRTASWAMPGEDLHPPGFYPEPCLSRRDPPSLQQHKPKHLLLLHHPFPQVAQSPTVLGSCNVWLHRLVSALPHVFPMPKDINRQSHGFKMRPRGCIPLRKSPEKSDC
jgi:hypothetical protein